MHLGGEVPLTIEVVEPTGSETHVVGRIGATPVVGVFRERIAAGPGERIGIAVEAARHASLRRRLGSTDHGLNGHSAGQRVPGPKPANTRSDKGGTTP